MWFEFALCGPCNNKPVLQWIVEITGKPMQVVPLTSQLAPSRFASSVQIAVFCTLRTSSVLHLYLLTQVKSVPFTPMLCRADIELLNGYDGIAHWISMNADINYCT